ncbi:16S rRNA (guanine(527)-N(7))-methyltransferase RsmG [Mycoplasmopsis arginini]|uniref:16S rRNA (guanine(527)-N(7))-methyltransferase RsmG n=1 Tax=Mycoplasmopsis arginini TaxID=2094 RepID=UPI003517B976
MKTIATEEFNNLINEYLGETDKEIVSRLWIYYSLIEEENQKYNLTGFYGERLIKEGIIESILIFKNINDQVLDLNQKKVLDIGSGAGFPIIPYFIYNPNFDLTIYEPMQKRVNFLNLVISKCNLKNIRVLKLRAEDSKEYEIFDFISARAVSELKNLVEISHHLGKLNSTFCFLKSTSFQKEIYNSSFIQNTLKIKYKALDLKTFFSINNVLVYYQKTSKTPDFIPRKWAIIIKDNLKK